MAQDTCTLEASAYKSSAKTQQDCENRSPACVLPVTARCRLELDVYMLQGVTVTGTDGAITTTAGQESKAIHRRTRGAEEAVGTLVTVAIGLRW